MLSTNQKGAIAETAITHAAVKLGIAVYRPVAEGGRFDLIFPFPDASLSRVHASGRRS
jgi:PD-(D/E)XK endonuclease